MDESFLHSLRREPSGEFARNLLGRLQQSESRNDSASSRPRAVRAAALAASIALAAFAFSFPSVRAAAQAFLDLFRVVNFAAVPVNIDRISQLRSGKLDVPQLLGGQVEVLKQPGAPVQFDSIEAAASAAGIQVKLPAWRPVGWELSDIEVLGERAVRVTASATKLKEVLDALNINDLTVPESIDGKTVTVHVSPAVAVTYRNAAQSITLLQTHSPNAQFPAGIDLPTLGEIGLRILGLDSAEAHRFAQTIDWRTTLIVPVPVTAASFRQVDVQGSPGLLIQTTASPVATANAEGATKPEGPAGGAGSRKHRGGNVLLWSAGDRVFALQGTLDSAQLLEMAQSLQ